MLMTDVVHDFAQTSVATVSEMSTSDLTSLMVPLAERARSALASDGFAGDQQELRPSADMRFQGQEHTVEVPLDAIEVTDEQLAALPEKFAAMHEERYGHRSEDAVEIVTARLRAIGRVPRPELPVVGPGDPDNAAIGVRSVYRHAGAVQEYGILRRDALGRGQRLQGPVIIEELTATTVVHAGDSCAVGDHGELIIEVAPEAASTTKDEG
jgi:N-methylhydantoinase A